MDECMFPENKKTRRPKDTASGDLFATPQDIPREKPPREAPYQPASDSSRKAAQRITPKALDLRSKVLMAITAAGERGATRKELETVTGMLTQTLCARLNELEHERAIVKHQVINARHELEIVRRDGCSVYVLTARTASAA